MLKNQFNSATHRAAIPGGGDLFDFDEEALVVELTGAARLCRAASSDPRERG